MEREEPLLTVDEIAGGLEKSLCQSNRERENQRSQRNHIFHNRGRVNQ